MERLDLQRPPGKFHTRANSRPYQRGYTDIPHLTWGESGSLGGGGVDPGPNPPAGASPSVGTWDWFNGVPLEADIVYSRSGTEVVLAIHPIDIPDVDHTALFDQVQIGWWVYASVPGKLSVRIKVTYRSKDAGYYTFLGDPADETATDVPSVGDDTTVWVQDPTGVFQIGSSALDAHVSNPGNFTIAEIEAWVDDHADLADEVLSHEQARTTPRVTLVDWLQGFISNRDEGHVP